MNIIPAFLGEHAVIYSLLDKIERKKKEWSPDETRLAVIVLASALESHAVLEEDLLFKELEPHLGLGHGPLGVMLAEHELIEATLARLALASAEEIVPLVEQLIKTTREHFDKEESVLFGLAEKWLTAEMLEELGSQWARRRSVDVSSTQRSGE